MKDYYVYIISNENRTIYIGVTNNLVKRVYEHKNKFIDGFTKKYNCNKLVYYEKFNNINNAIIREKRLKKWKREWKNNLIESFNQFWDDLYENIV